MDILIFGYIQFGYIHTNFINFLKFPILIHFFGYIQKKIYLFGDILGNDISDITQRYIHHVDARKIYFNPKNYISKKEIYLCNRYI